MAPIEVEFYGQRPLIIDQGQDIRGIMSRKLFSDYRLRMRFHCQNDNLNAGAEIELLKVEPRFSLGPVDIFERRKVVDKTEVNLKGGESKTVQMHVNGRPTAPITIRHIV